MVNFPCLKHWLTNNNSQKKKLKRRKKRKEKAASYMQWFFKPKFLRLKSKITLCMNDKSYFMWFKKAYASVLNELRCFECVCFMQKSCTINDAGHHVEVLAERTVNNSWCLRWSFVNLPTVGFVGSNASQPNGHRLLWVQNTICGCVKLCSFEWARLKRGYAEQQIWGHEPTTQLCMFAVFRLKS